MAKETLLTSLLITLLISCGMQRNLPQSGASALHKAATVKKVLIVGAGSAASHVFMDHFSKNMGGFLRKMDIASNYIFLEKIKPGTQFDNSALDSLDYDAYIILYPLDSGSLRMNATGKIPVYRGFSINAVVPNAYKQEFAVQTYKKTDKVKPVWETRLQVELDPANDEQYKDLCYYIFNYLPLD